MSDDLSPGVWPIVRSRGDGFTPTAFSVEVDDIPVVVTGALAQVRAKPLAHVKIFIKDTAHLLGLRAATR